MLFFPCPVIIIMPILRTPYCVQQPRKAAPSQQQVAQESRTRFNFFVFFPSQSLACLILLQNPNFLAGVILLVDLTSSSCWIRKLPLSFFFLHSPLLPPHQSARPGFARVDSRSRRPLPTTALKLVPGLVEVLQRSRIQLTD